MSPGSVDVQRRRKAGTVSTLARAIVHAANLGAKVINVSVTACVPAADPLDQRALGAAVWFAATAKDAVIVAAGGNEGEDGCAQNPELNPLEHDDPRDWKNVKTVSSPSWFADYVLSVGAVDNKGIPVAKSLAGPWVALAAPGVGLWESARQWAAGVERGGAVIVALTGVLVVVALVRGGWRHPLAGVVVTQLALLTIVAADVIGPERNASRTTLPLAVAAVVMVATPRARVAVSGLFDRSRR